MKCKREKIAAVILLLFFIFNCGLEDIGSYNQNPFRDFDARVKLIERNLGNQQDSTFNRNFEVIENSFLTGESFDLVQINNDMGLIFSQTDQKIIKISRRKDNYTSEIIAESGRGPDQIDNGIRLIKSNGKVLLIQRNRISEVTDVYGNIGLEAIRNMPIYLNFYSDRKSQDSLIINTYSFRNETTFRVINSSFKNQGYKGGKTVNKNEDVNKIFNFNLVSSNGSNSYYLQAFLFLPYIGVFDSDLNLLSILKFDSFQTIKLDEDDLEVGDVSMIDTKLHTVLAGLHPFGDDKYWIIYEDRYYTESNKNDFNKRRINKTFHYYEIDKDLETIYKGESKNYLVPFNDIYVSVRNGSLIYF
ncbi:MAG: hypothetical protein ABJK11_13500 [Balneola sp.]